MSEDERATLGKRARAEVSESASPGPGPMPDGDDDSDDEIGEFSGAPTPAARQGVMGRASPSREVCGRTY